jgi:hypothetical protein
MDKVEIKEKLNQKYNRENWKNLSKNIFKNNVEFYSNPRNIEIQNEKVLSFFELGRINLNDHKKVSLFELKVTKNLNIYKNKVELRNLVSKFIDQVTNHGVLVIYDNQGENYRLTFSTKFSQFLDTGELKEVETEPKRFTYLLGESESCITPAERLYLLHSKRNNLLMDDFVEAFNVEKISKEFFEQYKMLCFDIENNLISLRKKDKKIDNNFKKSNLIEINFAKKLLGQIVFIYFLQKKGWLGIKKNSSGDYDNWGKGNKAFFKLLFEKKFVKYNNFFNDVLEPLFYEGLGSERSGDVYTKLDCKIPFLNGGLFEPIKNYDWSQTEITLNNEIFSKIIDVFERFNFTVQEEDPEEKEIAVDPEMLGKVFENLLPENIRKKGGSFYTPRVIVSYMCEQSILHYLLAKTKNKIPINDLEEYVVNTKFDVSKNSNIKTNAKTLDDLLANVKICDPAVGSGAFPVSLMNIIIRLRLSLISFLDRKYKNSSYYFKRDCIQNSIYGVDIDDSAIEIAKLRLWLSLVVDEDNYEKIEPLPNLDFKIVQGNSLLETFHDFQLGSSIFKENKENTFEKFLGSSHTQNLLIELSELQDQFFKSISHSKKKILKDKIEQKIISIFKENIKVRKEYNIKKFEKFETQIQDLISGKLNKNFFPWQVFFSEVFLKNEGFDIIITNPPYVNTKEISKFNWREDLKANFGFLDDLYNHFAHLAFLISRENGIITFISSDTFMTLQTKQNLRSLLLKNKLISILPTPKAFTAMVDTCIFIVQKNILSQDHKINFVNLRDLKFDEFQNIKKNTDIPIWEYLLQPIFENIKVNNKNLISSELFKSNLNLVIFNPSKKNLKIREKIIPELKKMYDKYWPAIKTSRAISDSQKILEEYNQNLTENSLAMLGLVTKGGQGLATGNNGDFIGCLEGTIEAKRVYKQRPIKVFELIKNERNFIKKFKKFSKLDNINKVEKFLENINEEKIRDYFFKIKKEFGRDVFGQGFLYRVISKEEIIDIEDLSEREKKDGINKEKKIYVKYDKGDKEGNRWYFKTPYYIKWDRKTVKWFDENSGRSGTGMPVIRNKRYYFKEGFCWSDVHTFYLKSRLKEKSVYDVSSMSLLSINKKLNDKYLVCLINSKFISKFQEDFLNNTSHFQINDARKLPIIVPSKKKLQEFIDLFDEAKKIKLAYFKNKISEEEQEKKLGKIQAKVDLEVEKLYNL